MIKAVEKSVKESNKDTKKYEDLHIPGHESAYEKFEGVGVVAEKTEGEEEDAEEAYDDEFYCPAERYLSWENLTNEVDAEYIVAAEFELHYTPEYWNTFTSPVEDIDWGSLYEDMQIGAGAMGYNLERWDCCINHYNNYDWDDLDDDEYPALQLSMEVLGWDNHSWTTSVDEPESERNTWGNLTLFEQAAADFVCFDESLWNGDALPWGNVTEQSPPKEMDFNCPNTRYLSWNELEPAHKYAALDLGYDEFSWNNWEDPIEELSWEDITIEADWHQALLDLGYEEQKWDCCINNYMSYDFWELDDVDEFPLLQTAVDILGWNESNWETVNASQYPISEHMYWRELSDLEKAAADYLCYYEESWDDHTSIYEQEEALEEEEDAE